MPLVMARHDAISKSAVERYSGTIVKMTGDGVHAAFDRPLDALNATLEIQQQLSKADAADGLPLPLRCGLHAGIDERRDGDFYGRSVNRAARIMCAAHGGQMLLSKAVAEQVNGMLPDGVSLRDLGVVRLRDLSSPEHIFQLLHPQLRADFPALRSLEGTPNNLAQQLNSFIGRERERAEIKEMLASSRLVTLLGMGGIGKSRLSMQLAAEVLDDFPDGVWFVELAALTDASSVPQAVASVLGVKEEAGRPVIDALKKYVRDLQVLIILDNCEQVIHGCADLAKRLLQAGPRVKILTSSRDYLQVAGEMTYHVPTLSVPKEVIALERLRQHEGVRLFVDRAAASKHGFGLTEQNAAAVVKICRCLDGIPLAIELAAARVRGLSVQVIAERLSDRFRLLITGDQTVLPRQRTLRALIDWSYDLLSEQERALFERLSVFAGGWTLEAAETVCAHAAVRSEDVIGLLTHLVEKSLVILEASGDRYRMLDTVRHYAQEKLNKSNESQVVRVQHHKFYLAFAEEARPELAGPAQIHWLNRLDLEHDNLVSAHASNCTREDGAADGLRMIFALRPYWIHRGLLELGHRMSLRSLSNSEVIGNDVLRSQGLHVIGQLCCYLGRYAEAIVHLETSLSIANSIADKTRIAAVQQPLGLAYAGQGDNARARFHFENAVTLTRSLGNKRQLMAAINALAQSHRAEGQFDEAKPLYENVLALARELGDQQSVAIALLNLAMVFIGDDFTESARDMLLEVLTIAMATGSQPAAQSALEVGAGLAAKERQWDHAARFFGAAKSYQHRTGLHRDSADDAFLAPLIASVRTALDVERYTAAEAAGQMLSHEEAMSDMREWLREAQSISHSL